MVKYGATLCGYCVLAIPVFGAGSDDYLAKMKSDPSGITRDYIRNSSLLINMSKAIGRIAISYKELQNLAGYTHLINEMDKVLFDLDKGNYVRTSVVSESGTGNLNMLDRGKFQEATYIKFENVPIVSPNGDVLVESMNFQVGLSLTSRSTVVTTASSLDRTDAERAALSESWVSSGRYSEERSSDRSSRSSSTSLRDRTYRLDLSKIRSSIHTSSLPKALLTTT
jgi:ABC-type uncharacterized transport system fused permease/ATPase subunit